MSASSYAKDGSLVRRIWVRPLAGASRLEIVVLLATIAIGILVGIIVGSFPIGFLAVMIFAGVARVILWLLDSGDTGSPKAMPQPKEARSYEKVHS